VKTALITLLLIFCASPAWAATYYVDVDADPGGDGTTTATTGANCAFDTIAALNVFIDGAGLSDDDSIAFQGGDTFDDETFGHDGAAIVWGNVDGITVTTYGTGRAIIDGDTIQPIYIDGDAGGSDVTNLTIENLDTSGQEWQDAKSNNCTIRDVEGLIIQDMYHDGYAGSASEAGAQEGKSWLALYDVTNIQILDNTVFSCGPDGMPSSNGVDIVALHTHECSGTLDISDNTAYDIEADWWMDYSGDYTDGSANFYNNTIYNCGENCIDFKSTRYVDVYSNTFYREADFRGVGGSNSPTGVYPLITIHVDTETPGTFMVSNLDIYENEFGPSDVYM